MFVKFASAAVLSAERRPKPSGLQRLASFFGRTAHKATFDYEPREGYIYVRSRMISSRCNDNFDEFPAPEIKKGYRTFVGRPVYVNHDNDDPSKARGVIIDAALHEDTTPQGLDDIWVEGLMEIDAVTYPKLAKALLNGDIERTSMGVNIDYSICSFCGNKAETPFEYCRHVPAMKGTTATRVTASGDKEDVLIRERCYGLNFFENSVLVEPPADPTAHFLDVDDRGVSDRYTGGLAKAASRRKTAMSEGCINCECVLYHDEYQTDGYALYREGELPRWYPFCKCECHSGWPHGYEVFRGDPHREGSRRKQAAASLPEGMSLHEVHNGFEVSRGGETIGSVIPFGPRWKAMVNTVTSTGDSPEGAVAAAYSRWIGTRPSAENERMVGDFPAGVTDSLRGASRRRTANLFDGFPRDYLCHHTLEDVEEEIVFSSSPNAEAYLTPYLDESFPKEDPHDCPLCVANFTFTGGSRRTAMPNVSDEWWHVFEDVAGESGPRAGYEGEYDFAVTLTKDANGFQFHRGRWEEGPFAGHEAIVIPTEFSWRMSRSLPGGPNFTVALPVANTAFLSKADGPAPISVAASADWTTVEDQQGWGAGELAQDDEVCEMGPDCLCMETGDPNDCPMSGYNPVRVHPSEYPISQRPEFYYGSRTPRGRRKMNRRTALDDARVPVEVNTLSGGDCPVCGEENYDGDECGTCGYSDPGAGEFTDPDLSKAKEFRETGVVPAEGDEDEPDFETEEDVEDPEGEQPMDPEEALHQTAPEDEELLGEALDMLKEVRQMLGPDEELGISLRDEVRDAIEEMRGLMENGDASLDDEGEDMPFDEDADEESEDGDEPPFQTSDDSEDDEGDDEAPDDSEEDEEDDDDDEDNPFAKKKSSRARHYFR